MVGLRAAPVLRRVAGLCLGLATVVACDNSVAAREAVAGTEALIVVESRVVATGLAGVVGAVGTSDGAVAVADGGAASLTVFRSGRPPVVIGRKGSGPGEFRMLYRLHLCGSDTLIAYDFEGKLQVFSDTALVRSIQLPAQLAVSDFVGCTSANDLIFTKPPNRIPGVGVHFLPLTVFRFSLEGESIEWLANLRGSEMFISEQHQSFYERPFGSRSFVAAGVGGVASAESDRLELRTLESAGMFETQFFFSTSTRAPKSTELNRYKSDRVAEEPDSASRKTIRAVLDEAPPGKSLPEIDRLVASSSGAFWLRRAPLAADSLVEWLVIDGPSAIVQRIMLDRSLRVQFVDSSRVLVLREAADGYDQLLELAYRRQDGSRP